MECNVCGNEMRVNGSRYALKNDDDKEKPTRLFVVLTMRCRSGDCPEHERDVEIWHEQRIGAVEEAEEAGSMDDGQLTGDS